MGGGTTFSHISELCALERAALSPALPSSASAVEAQIGACWGLTLTEWTAYIPQAPEKKGLLECGLKAQVTGISWELWVSL